jgi:DNA polymerase-3 subunit gamma/tau
MSIHELDAASNNSVEDIRNLIEQVRVIPQIGHYSVFIIDEVHMLSQAAFNAFLKTLEEPPQHAIFILATTEKHKIIPTILSRCQIYDFNRIRVEDAVEYLRYIANSEGVTADDQSLNLIAQKADGGMRDALSMFDKAVSFCGTTLEYKAVASTLNVLDYDTYFRFTDLLLGGDYVNALLEFDAVLTKGFSGQVFMNGLNQHMRDLLVAKGPAVNLIEFTGELLESYRRQASNCDTAFLFGAISMLSEADGKLRTASNQRLLVELTLMKIAALSQKKNSELTLPVEESYPLPSLDEPQRVVTQPVTQPQVVATPQPQVVAAPTAQAAAEVKPEPKRVVVGGGNRRNSINSALASGSITDLMKSVSGNASAEESEDRYTDPQSEKKLQENREKFIAAIVAKHPRFSPAFEKTKIRGNTISVEVPSAIMRDDLYNSRSEITEIITDISGISGVVKLDIVLNEVEVKLRPVKLEDRVAHISDRSPLFDELVTALELELD